MDKRPVIICLALAVLHTHACAQFTDPRTYENTPVGVNQLELAYAYVRSNTSIVVSPNSRNSFTFEFAKAAVHRNGPSLTGFAVRYDYIWGKGYR